MTHPIPVFKSKALAREYISELLLEPKAVFATSLLIVQENDPEKTIQRHLDEVQFWAKATARIRAELKEAYEMIEEQNKKLLPKEPTKKGGKREGSGRKKEMKTVTIRVPEELADELNRIGKHYKKTPVERCYIKEEVQKLAKGL